MLSSSLVFLHDNARPHTAARTQALLEHLIGSCLTILLIALTHSERLSPVYMPEELVTITALQQGVDGRCKIVAELTGGRFLWHGHTKTYSPTQVPQFWQ
jgi:hypothetical protein